MKKITPREGLLWKRWESLAPDKVALIDAAKNISWTVHALNEESASFFERLRSYAPQETIAFRIPNGAEWMALFLALQRAGLVAMPLDASLPVEGCFEVARGLGVKALYVNGEFHALGKTPQQKRKGCCVKVTSGSDGLPKTVECQGRHLIADGENIIATMKIRPGDRNLAAIPLGHSYGLGNLVMPLILQGTAMVCAAEYVLRQLLDWIGLHGVTIFPGVPALFRALATYPTGPDLRPLRTVISAGAVLSPAVAQAFFDRYGIKIHNFYGSSETGGICYDRTGTASLTGRSVGKPLAGVSLSIQNRRIEVKSGAVATRSGKWQVNDCAEWNQRGELVLLGRRGQDANIGGKKVHPLEVERLLRSLDKVTDAAVWIHHEQSRDFLVAAVETPLSQGYVEKILTAQLPAWKLPKNYFIAAELPRTGRGKLDLPAIRQAMKQASV